MSAVPSAILLLRLMTVGTETNLWGGYLNTLFQTIERAAKGYQAYPVTGDALISWSNYSATNDLAVGMAKFTGSPSAAWALTLPGNATFLPTWNASGKTGTLKNSGGTGVSVPDGRRSLLYSDATDVGEASPNWLANPVTTLTNPGDIVVKTTLETAIANAALPASAGTVRNSVADTTAGFIATKLTFSGSLVATTSNPGANETRDVTFTFDEGQTALMAGVYSL